MIAWINIARRSADMRVRLFRGLSSQDYGSVIVATSIKE